MNDEQAADFAGSWESVEAFYRTLGHPLYAQVLGLIASMRRKGYDRSLRAGTSMDILILSRARGDGLRKEQPYVAFLFSEDGTMEVCCKFAESKKLTCRQIELSREIEDRLKELEVRPVD